MQLEKLGKRYTFNKLIVLHSGGWKKLSDQAVSHDVFSRQLKDSLGSNTVVHNFYGMVEQTGSIYMACEYGHLHVPVYADIRIRDPQTFEILPKGEAGLIETRSLLARSYPGHALLTQDLGCIDGEDDCPCGRLGKYFSVIGRQTKAVIKGCSDTYNDQSVDHQLNPVLATGTALMNGLTVLAPENSHSIESLLLQEPWP